MWERGRVRSPLSLLVVAVLPVGAFFNWFWHWLSASKDSISAFKDVATVFGIGAAVRLYFKTATAHAASRRFARGHNHALNSDRLLVVLHATMKNHGVVP